MNRNRWYSLPLLVCLLLAGLGCSPGLVKVKGIVTLDGKPLPRAVVSFHPDQPGPVASGQADGEGNFELTSHNPGDGAMPGQYHVLVSIEDPAPDLGSDAANVPIAEMMQRYAKAMEERRKHPLPPLPKVPVLYSQVAQTPLAVKVPADGLVQLELDSSRGPPAAKPKPASMPKFTAPAK